MTTVNSNKAQKIHFIYSAILSICLIISGLLLIIACVNIYNSGEQPFSRESVAKAFSAIAIPVYISLILTIVGFMIDLIFSTGFDKTKPVKSYSFILDIMYQKRDISNNESSAVIQIGALQKSRKINNIIRSVVLVICSAVFLVYSLNSKNYHQSNINDSMIKAMFVLIPCLLVAFVCALYTVIQNERSIQTEIELLKQCPIKKDSTNKTNDKPSFDKAINIIKYAVLTLGVFLLIYGFITGGTADVLTKAINICTECIGLG